MLLPWLWLAACDPAVEPPPIEGTSAAEAADALVRAGQAASELAAQAAAVETLSRELREGSERPSEEVLVDLDLQLERARSNAHATRAAVEEAEQALDASPRN